MSDQFLPGWATAQEASEWLESETGQEWPLARLLETVHKLSVWIDCRDDEPDHIIEGLFQGRREGFRAEVIFASDIERLKFVRDGGTLHISRRPDGTLVRFTPPIKFPVDELRFEADCLRRLAAMVGATSPLSEPIQQGGASAGAMVGNKRRPQTNAERVAAAKHAASVNVSSRGYWPPSKASEPEGIDWSHWAKLHEVKVFEALALLDGQEPPENCPDADDESPAYRKRMRLLLDALSNREWFGPLTLNISEPLLHGLNLAELGRWARANGYTLPEEFPRAAAQAGAVRASAATAPVIRWNLWMSAPHVLLWEAVALVLNIEPRSLKHSGQAWMDGPGGGPIFEPHSFPSATSRDDFNTALSFAERAANVAGPIHLRTGLAVGMNKRTASVSLQEVVAFFVSCDWPDIPSQLLALLSPSAAAKADEESVHAQPPMAATNPEPLTTGHIAHCFDGLGWDEKGWKKPLADKPKWLKSCVEVEGRQGVRETAWNPVCIGAGLHRQKGIAIRTVRARFQTNHLLKPWLESWKDYEAENFESD